MKAVFFSPHSFIWLHAYPEALIAEALRTQNYEVTYISCGRVLESWCVSMESEGHNESLRPEAKNSICNKCVGNKQLLVDHFGLRDKSLREFISTDDARAVDEHLAKITVHSLIDFAIDGIEIGRAALYNFLLNHKRTVAQINEDDLEALKLHLRSTMLSFYAGRKILDSERPDRLIFYSSSYSANLVVMLQAQKMNIPCFSIFAGNNWATRLQSLHIATNDSFTQMENRSQLWVRNFSGLPATRHGLRSAEVYIRTLMTGNSIFIYGGATKKISATLLREKFGIGKEQKVLFAATSSNDELAAAQIIRAIPETIDMAFANQLIWLRETITYVASRKDLFLIVRVHPREFANQRESNSSTHSRELQELLKSLPENVAVNWPSDNLSLYDFIDIIDLGLTAWSSVGKELALWGLPNLTFVSGLGFYPKAELGYVADTSAAYFETIEIALREGFDSDRLYRAYRWLAYELEEGVIDMADAIDLSVLQPIPLRHRIINKLLKRRLSQEERWLKGHSAPVKNAKMIADRITNLTSVEETMLPLRKQLTHSAERKMIRKSVKALSIVRFGKHWLRSFPTSYLQESIQSFLKET